MCVYKKIICCCIATLLTIQHSLPVTFVAVMKKRHLTAKKHAQQRPRMVGLDECCDWSQLCQHNDLTYYAPNYAGIICQGLALPPPSHQHPQCFHYASTTMSHTHTHTSLACSGQDPGESCLFSDGGYLARTEGACTQREGSCESGPPTTS